MTAMDMILTILGTSLFLPFIVQCFHMTWNKGTWSRQLLLLAMLLQWTAIMYIPSVMYICLGILTVTFGIYLFFNRPRFQLTPFLIVLALYMGWFTISLSWSVVPWRGVHAIVSTGGPLLLFALIGNCLRTTKTERVHMLQLACSIVYIFLAMSLLSWLCTCAELHLYPWQWPILQKMKIEYLDTYQYIFRWLGGLHGYTHPSYNLLPVFAITCLSISLRKLRIMPAYSWWLLWAASALITLLAQSRMGIMFILIEFFAYIILLQPTLRRVIIATVITICISLVAIGGTFSFWRQYGFDPIRETLVTRTLLYIQVKPWTGAGAGSLNPVEICHTIGVSDWPRVGDITPDMRVEDWTYRTRMLPHNQWLADWAHAGLLAAVLCLALYICLAVRGIRTKQWEAMIFLLIFIIFSLLEPPFYIGKGLYLFGMLTTWLSLER